MLKVISIVILLRLRSKYKAYRSALLHRQVPFSGSATASDMQELVPLSLNTHMHACMCVCIDTLQGIYMHAVVHTCACTMHACLHSTAVPCIAHGCHSTHAMMEMYIKEEHNYYYGERRYV